MPFDAHVSTDSSDVQQPPSTTEAQAAAVLPVGDAAKHAEDSAAPVWLQRFSLFVLVLFCVYLGVMVTILPWWTRVWDRNLFIQSHPMLATVLYNGAVRGLISGCGLLDIWIGISEAIHYRDHRR